MRSFAMEQKAGEIIGIVQEFVKEWGKYREIGDKMGRSLKTLTADFDSMITTRERALEKRLEQITSIEQITDSVDGAPVL